MKKIISTVLISFLPFAVLAQFYQFHGSSGSGQVRLSKVITSNNNGVFVAGECTGDTLSFSGAIQANIINSSFIAYIDSSGSLQWAHPIEAAGGMALRSFSQLPNDDIIMSGYFWDSIHFQNLSQFAGSSGGGSFYWRISSSGVLKGSLRFKDYPSRMDIIRVLSFDDSLSLIINAEDSLWLPDSTVVKPMKSPSQFGLVLRLDNNDSILGYSIVDSDLDLQFTDADKHGNSLLATISVGRVDSIFVNYSPHSVFGERGVILVKAKPDFTILQTLGFSVRLNSWFRVHSGQSKQNILLFGVFSGTITYDPQFPLTNNDFPGNSFGLQDGFAIILDSNLAIQDGFSIGMKSNNDNISGGLFINNKAVLAGTSGQGSVMLNQQDTLIQLTASESYLIENELTSPPTIRTASQTNGTLFPQSSISGIFPYKNGFGVYGFSNGDITFTNSTDTLFRRSSRVGFIWFFDSYLDLQEWQSKQQNLSIYPNPSRHWVELKINLEQAEELLVEMLSLDGKTQRQRQHFSAQGQSGENILRYSTAHLAPGLYLLRVRNQQGAVLGQEKLVVH